MEWKDIQFYALEIKDIQEGAWSFSTRHAKLKQQTNWPVYDMLKKNMDEFKRTMALLPDLRDESMRTRHWNMLRLEVKEEFNEKSDDFTLEEVFKLRFLEYENDIVSLTDEAKK